MFELPLSGSDAMRWLMREIEAAGVVFENANLEQIYRDQQQGLCTTRLHERFPQPVPTLDRQQPFLDIDGTWIQRDSYTERFALAVDYADRELEFVRRLSV